MDDFSTLELIGSIFFGGVLLLVGNTLTESENMPLLLSIFGPGMAMLGFLTVSFSLIFLVLNLII